MTTLVADVETDGLLDELTRIWVLCVTDPNAKQVDVYADQPGYTPLVEGLDRLKEADRVVFHNGLGFDFFAINRLYPGTLRFDQIYDTLVVSRLLEPQRRAHALEDFGKRFGTPKVEHDDWTKFSKAMVHRCVEDCKINAKVFRWLWNNTKGWGESVALEHKVRLPISLQEHNGFKLDVDAAVELEGELRQEQQSIEEELSKVFKPCWVARKGQAGNLFPWFENAADAVKTPKIGKPTGKGRYVKGAPFTPVEYLDFNPGSRRHIEAWLRKEGWTPKAYTNTGVAKLDDKVLKDLAIVMPKAEPLARYFRVGKQLGQLSDGKNAWLKLVTSEGRVHGAVNTNGARTGRMSHFHPNLAQVDKKDLRMRAVWIPSDGMKLVGVDADGLELRILAHYLYPYDGGELARRLLEGTKEDGTDVHSVNTKILKGYSRDHCGKRFIYAFIYGAGDKKLGLILIEDAILAEKYTPKASPHLFKKKKNGKFARRSPTDLGKEARANIEKGITGLDKLLKAVRTKHNKQKWLKGLDGRKLPSVSIHSALNTLLQGGGSIVMKKALAIFHFEAAPYVGWLSSDFMTTKHFAYCANVHDEVQLEAEPDIADDLGVSFAECIKSAGERLGVRCPLSGSSDVGSNWKDTH